MPFLAQALDPMHVQGQLDRLLLTSGAGRRSIRLRAIRVARYKPERRCLFEYAVVTEEVDGRQGNETFLGKARAKGIDRSSYQVLRSLWQNGFSDSSQDGISVPEPLGLIPEFHMGLQRKMPGVTATKALAGSNGAALAQKIAWAAHKLHLAGVAIDRSHSISDELRILDERLGTVAQLKPRWKGRLDRLLDACGRLAATIQAPPPAGIHRDFYADQILLDGKRLFILDLDLYCQGDPALDIGNFIAHITEYSLRELGSARALEDRERALEEQFVALAGDPARVRVRAYALLTLARHIYLSTQFPERQALTEDLLELCEQRFAQPLA